MCMKTPDIALKSIQSPLPNKTHARSRNKVHGINQNEQLFAKILTCNKLAAIKELAGVATGSKMADATIPSDP